MSKYLLPIGLLVIGAMLLGLPQKPYEIYMVCSYDYSCVFKYDRQAPINIHVKFTDDIRKSSKTMPYPEQAHFAVVGDPTYLKWIDIPLDKKPYLVSDMKIEFVDEDGKPINN